MAGPAAGMGASRLLGVVGTCLAFVAPIVIEILGVVSGLSAEAESAATAISLVSYLLVLGAVYLISRAASAPWIFRFYLVSFLLSVLATGLGLYGYYYFQGWTAYSVDLGVQYLALALGIFCCDIAAGAFVFASFARIHDALKTKGFLWAGRLIFVASVANIAPFVGGVFGLVGVVMQLVAFGALGRGAESNALSPAPGETHPAGGV